MDSELSKYIQEVTWSVNQEDGIRFRNCISISPGSDVGMQRAKFPEPSEFDLFQLSEKFRSVVRAYLKMMKAVYIYKDIERAFNELDDMVNHLNRAADSQTNWINCALINACTELMAVHKVKLQSNPEEESIEFQYLEVDDVQPSSLEKLANTINRSFKLSLNDKNLDLELSKRTDIYFFLGALIKIYYQLGKLEMAKSVEKALNGSRFQLPPLNGKLSAKKYAVYYLYYSALLALDDANFVKSQEKLEEALNISTYYKNTKSIQIEKILLILIPLQLYNNRFVASERIWKDFPRLRIIYKENLFKAISSGNIKQFNLILEKFELLFLKKHIYLLVENLKILCYYRLMKKTALYLKSLNEGSKENHIISLTAFQLALDISNNGGAISGDILEPTTLEEIECILANLISSGKIKGYLSHSNKCIVLSKQNPFPNHVIS